MSASSASGCWIPVKPGSTRFYVSGTGADPARMFRAYFSMMKHQTTEFRKLINFN